jgi:UDP-N-acetylglucosamine 4,6-dehydratase
MSNIMNGSAILLTGGTGSFGQKFTEIVLRDHSHIDRLVIFSRDELKQYEMATRFSPSQYPQLRYFIGDVRDKERLWRAMEGVDTVIHAAALKHVPVAEYNPFEAIKTNVMGAQNVIEVAIDRGVRRVVALSTDKAAAPINLYGATKLCSDKLFVAANNFKGKHDVRFSVVRYGNVIGSRGSVIPLYLRLRKSHPLPVTDTRMTRFNITLDEGVRLVLFALEDMHGGEIYVPKIPSYRLVDVAEAITPGGDIEIIGIRPGEKLHEEMITETDALSTLEFDNYFIIVPSSRSVTDSDWAARGGRPCPFGFRYSSDSNGSWLTVEDLRRLIREYVDADFTPA